MSSLSPILSIGEVELVSQGYLQARGKPRCHEGTKTGARFIECQDLNELSVLLEFERFPYIRIWKCTHNIVNYSYSIIQYDIVTFVN